MTDDLEEAWRDLNVPPEDNGCIRCGKKVNTDGSEVTWRCIGCNRLVCRDCTLCEPGQRGRDHEYRLGQRETLRRIAEMTDGDAREKILSELAKAEAEPTFSYVPSPGGIRYMDDTLCSLRCWERIGKPEE